LATVRIYRVAELLGTTSQEVVALLKRDHGIEVKSASSTIEEVVARSFVERVARQRSVALPSGDMFAETPAGKGKRPGAQKKVEPPKPVATLPPPRLVKTIRPRPVAEPEPGAPIAEAHPEAALEAPPVPHVAEQAPPAPIATAAAPAAAPPEEAPAVEPAFGASPVAEAPLAAAQVTIEATPLAAEPPVPAVAPEVEAPVAGAPVAASPAPAPEAPMPRPVMPAPGRVVPPTLRLRVEEAPPPPAPPLVPRVARPPAPALRKPAAPTEGARPTKTTSAGAAAATPGARAAAPAAARPAGAAARPAPAPRPVTGGPRPLPSQPVRPVVAARPAAAATVPRPGTMPARPPVPARPWVPPRPAGGARHHVRREAPRPVPVAAMPVEPPPVTRTITLAEGMTVKDLADKLEVKTKDVLKKLLDKRIMMTLNTTLDIETATMMAREFGADVQLRSFEEELLEVGVEEAHPEDRVMRAPVVTVMGHVDHGKTTLLDAIRETRVAEREAGGITQHIGAYNVTVNDRSVVFLDTPGHEAFTLMRARGARVTDVVVLVVAADDGVMPQTREAIDHARAANVPIVVAINKIDKPDANPERVKRELADLGLVPEQWGGQTVTVDVSAKKRQNLELLLEMILLVTDIGELKANPKRPALGTVLESQLDKGRGPVATVLVQDGTLRVGDTVIAGSVVGKVRALIDDRGRHVKLAGPSRPVEVLGLAGLPQPGDAFQAIADTAKARQVALFRQTKEKEKALSTRASRLTLESLKQQIAEGEVKELPIIIKADVQGSAEVLADTLAKLSDEKVKIRIIHSGVGAVNESDVLLASASNAIIIGFNVRPDRNASDVAEREQVDIRLHSIIYNVIDEMKKAVAGMLEPTLKEVRLGTAEVRETFKVPKVGTIAGCLVTDGRITRSGDAQVRLLRDHVVVFEGKIASLKRFKDDVSEVKAGFECGIALERFNDVKVGDVIEVFAIERVAAAVSQ
jgi:translation initiation factor IF-2